LCQNQHSKFVTDLRSRKGPTQFSCHVCSKTFNRYNNLQVRDQRSSTWDWDTLVNFLGSSLQQILVDYAEVQKLNQHLMTTEWSMWFWEFIEVSSRESLAWEGFELRQNGPNSEMFLSRAWNVVPELHSSFLELFFLSFFTSCFKLWKLQYVVGSSFWGCL
jgi:hypothetical protein